MSDDTRDLSWLGGPAPPLAAPVEHVLWVVAKDGRRAVCHARQHPLGLELRTEVDGAFLWSEVFKPGDGVCLGSVADEHKAAWVAKGWKEERGASDARSGGRR